MTATIEQLEAAIAALETQRSLLGDAIVDAGTAPMREKLAILRSQTRSRDQQLKAVSVLFMDIVGSTAMSRELDPEDIHVIVDGALKRFSNLVIARKGRVLQYAGDSMLAAFGADEAYEDDAECAVHAGLAIVEEAQRIAAEVEAAHRIVGFNVRVGINTGPVLLGGGVDEEGSIRGITVNIAARMEQSAPDGGLRITHDTYRQVRGIFDVMEEPTLVKGMDEPLRTYLVLRAKPRAFRLARRGVEGIECRMVGREAELKRLTDAFEDVIADETLSQITIVGDAGIGKSRLLDEFSNTLELQSREVWVFQGRAETHGEMLPYGVVRDVFFWRFQIEDSDTPAEARRKFTAALAATLGESVDEHAALLGQLIGLDFASSPFIAGIVGDPKQIRDRAFHSASRYFRAIASIDPVMLQLEDLHWADEGSLDFINHVAQSCRDLPMLVLCAARRSLFERRPLWGSGQGSHERIDLAPLARRSSRELADALLQKLQQPYIALRELITGGAEGNPFYMEELTKMLIDDGVIVVGGDHWQVLPERLARVHVPPTLVGVLQARIDALPPREKLALQVASVVGHVFWADALRSIDPTLVEALPALMARELVYGRETTAFEGVGEYVFKHHVLHQVTYDSVLKRDKRERHERVAGWLVAQSGERVSEHLALVAHHYEKAGSKVEAARYFRLAAEDALKSYANAAALDHLGRALALTDQDDAEGRFVLLSSRVNVFASTGKRDEQRADAERLAVLAEHLGDDAKRACAAGELARIAFYTADYARAASEGARGVALAVAAGMPAVGVDAHSCWLNALRMMGHHADAAVQAESLAALALTLGDHEAHLRVMSGLGGIAVDRGQYSVALAHFERGLAIARERGDRAREGGALGSMGDVQRCLGNFQEAIDLGNAATRLYREIGFTTYEALTLLNIATAMRLNGDARGALEPATRGVEVARLTNNADLRAAGALVAGDVRQALGDLDDAKASYQEALGLYRQIGREMMAIECLVGLARVAVAAGQPDEAFACIRDVTAYLEGGGAVDGTEDPIGIYLACHEVLHAVGLGGGEAYLRDGHAHLMKRAEPLAPDERDGFLRRVPSHRALIDALAKRDSAMAKAAAE
ncbi:MAG: adenylate/guanylate cyclase domain-containing protein [Burkholderiaceae bacterium]